MGRKSVFAAPMTAAERQERHRVALRRKAWTANAAIVARDVVRVAEWHTKQAPHRSQQWRNRHANMSRVFTADEILDALEWFWRHGVKAPLDRPAIHADEPLSNLLTGAMRWARARLD
jgi:hypothetical protein